MQARPTSSLTPAQCVGAAEARAAAACRDSEGATVSSRGVQPAPGPSAVPRRARGRAEWQRPLPSYLLGLAADPSTLFYTGPAPVRMILKSECGLLSPDQDSPKAGQKKWQKWPLSLVAHTSFRQPPPPPLAGAFFPADPANPTVGLD